MNYIRLLGSFVLLLAAVHNNDAFEDKELDNFHGESQLEQIQSPMLEVLMHLPPNFRDVRSFQNSLGIKPLRIKRKTEAQLKKNGNIRSITDVRSYEIAQPDSSASPSRSSYKRAKRDVELKNSKSQPILEKPEPEKLVSPLMGSGYRGTNTESMLPMPDAIRGPAYTTYPVKEFDVVDIDDPDDPRRRRNDSADDQDDNSQRDKRTFMEGGGEHGETTTTSPFWKRKKENPPFITGRGGSIPKDNAYTPPQHRSGESARESHSLKSFDKPVQSNEISRNNQDNYYASTNRRTYSRQSDNISPSTPKSVYDTIDYSGNNKRNQESGRANYGRNNDEKKDVPRDARPTHEQYSTRQYQYNHPSVYDRSFYPQPYPYPTEVVGRGVEFYHRTYDPSTGRIIYYANMPEHGRSWDYRFMDPINRNFYVNNRPYFYDPYYRNYVPPYDYRFSSGFGRSMDYMRSGRSSSQAYSYPFQEREKFPRDARYNSGFDKGNRLRDDMRNKTYVIYDADESRTQFPPRNQISPDGNRPGYPPISNNFPPPQTPPRNLGVPPTADFFPPGPFPFRNQIFAPPPGPMWRFNQRPGPGVADSNLNSRPEVQLPLTSAGRALSPGELEKSKKS